MITIAKNNKRIEETLDKFVEIIKAEPDVSILYSDTISTKEKDEKLLDFYKSKGIEDYELHVSNEVISALPFNQSINLDFMEKSDTYKPYTIQKGEYTNSNYAHFDEYGDSYTPLIVLDKTVELPMICEENIGWMTPVLFEEKTMRPCVERAFGHVLVVGLGIGFFPFNLLLKENVTKVTIIEYNKDIIDLFKENILPQFPRKDDIEIIHGNAYDYLNNAYINQYDYTFVDIWRNNEDGVPILSNCLKNIDLNEELSIDFWIEDAILEEVKKAFRIYLYMLNKGRLQKHLTNNISDSRDSENFITFDKIHRYFKDKKIKIKNNKDLMEIVNDKNLIRDMLKSF